MRVLLKDKRIRFLAVGSLNTISDISIYWLLATAGIAVIIANIISTSIGMMVSYTLNRNFTFRAQAGDKRRQIILFLVVTLFGLWVIQPVIILSAAALFKDIAYLRSFENLLPKLVATVASLVWNYCLYNKVVFKNKE